MPPNAKGKENRMVFIHRIVNRNSLRVEFDRHYLHRVDLMTAKDDNVVTLIQRYFFTAFQL